MATQEPTPIPAPARDVRDTTERIVMILRFIL